MARGDGDAGTGSGEGGESGDAEDDGKAIPIAPKVTGVAQRYMHLWREGFGHGRVSEREAREVLAQHRHLIIGAVRKFPRALLERGLLGEDDMIQLASVVLIQSWANFNAETGSFRGWALFCIRRRFARIREDIERLIEHEVEERHADAQHRSGGIQAQQDSNLVCEMPATGWDALDERPEDFEEALAERQRLELLETMIERLPRRQGFILRGLRDGRQLEDVAADLGITRQRADQIRKVAIDSVRAMLAAHIADREGELEEHPTLPACPATRSGSFSLAS